MELTRKLDGKTVKITLTEEELSQAHSEFVKNFMQNELESQFRLNKRDAIAVAESAYELYCQGDGHTEYDCIRIEYDEFYRQSLIRSRDDFSDAVRRISDGLTSEDYSVFTTFNDNVVEAYTANEQLYVEIVDLTELSLRDNRNLTSQAVKENTLTVFDNRISLVFDIQDPVYSSDVADFCSEVIPSETEWKCGSTCLGVLLEEQGLA